MRLLPKYHEPGWVTYIWLVYLIFFFEPLIASHAGRKQWIAALAGVTVFLVLYFSAFALKRPWNLLCISGFVVLGVAFAPFNGGAACFFIYAAAFIPFAVETEWTAVKLLAIILAIAGLETWILHLSWAFLFWSGFFSILIGVANIAFAQRNRATCKLQMAHEEVEHLAKVAERERIARDLHDVLGHTLSVIILKSELAGKLIDTDPARAKAEIADVEQTSRTALGEVRSTIRGYRGQSLEAEIKQAKATLETAGVSLKSQEVQVTLTPVQESVVALVVREAVTNVVRHAQARNCELRLAPQNGNCILEIHDDGRGGLQVEGNGLRGMRERIEALGGTFVRETRAGTRLMIQFPLTAKANGTH
ncbi:MAG: sensor histidine kinase [Terriglobales bacterium]